MASGMLLERGGRGHFERDPHEDKMILDKLGECGHSFALSSNKEKGKKLYNLLCTTNMFLLSKAMIICIKTPLDDLLRSRPLRYNLYFCRWCFQNGDK